MSPSTPGTQLGFLLARHGRIMNSHLRQALDSSGLSPRHAVLLCRLDESGPASQQDLIDFLSIDASALVAVLNDLERDGLAERRRDPADRRRHIVEITAEGKRAVASIDVAVADVEREAFTGFSAEELQQLHGLLSRIHGDTADEACAED
ncbi:MarR family winged helix-turn-helix transcriptional regulator [Arthrobacter bambusae]|uniref:MarR family winged helix-turn-helix transcriptional regulator n=1 Tax=Arthrobacter bambusae TaxID=1338426 RepID=UPI00278143C3|nr:MarR family transcriptional regulator [Arthrobacter bambusae]MDQ0031614.1 DNA-binding MarR family transcriptional regulator [Arthrobacter bambusae]MDQ0099838.1 DNA-binding MarR family transcriptional regulator [Arthrobacter bambusae]